MLLSGYMNTPTEPAFLALCHDMEYLMHHPHESIMYSGNKVFEVNDIPLRCFFKPGKAEINQIQQYSSFLHAYCDANHARDLTDSLSVTSNYHLFNGTIATSCFKKQTKNMWISSKVETRAMYTGVVD